MRLGSLTGKTSGIGIRYGLRKPFEASFSGWLRVRRVPAAVLAGFVAAIGRLRLRRGDPRSPPTARGSRGGRGLLSQLRSQPGVRQVQAAHSRLVVRRGRRQGHGVLAAGASPLPQPPTRAVDRQTKSDDGQGARVKGTRRFRSAEEAGRGVSPRASLSQEEALPASGDTTSHRRGCASILRSPGKPGCPSQAHLGRA